ncbi:hypothetical protein [Exiguobacterium sp. s192]|uniref:hypothetical protein n=1 Tax=Exiguobacterium sp. s192 TaxID=2751206 RepID=UPI001BE6B33B|nr:hypothetical protein [Exiguobacterium sp. s192]
MNFHTASSFRNIKDIQFINNRLIKQGHHLTYDWTQSERVDIPAALQRIGQLELDAVEARDCPCQPDSGFPLYARFDELDRFGSEHVLSHR